MRLQVLDTPLAVAAAAAEIVAETVDRQPEAVIGWPTGNTAVPLYDELARLHADGELDLSGVRGFNLDELILPRGDPHSFAAFMRRHAWGRTGLDPARCDIPQADADPAEECRRYDAAIGAAGGLDLAVLGVGADGHVAYNLPGTPVAGTHAVEVPEAVAEDLGIPSESRPLEALTIGMQTLKEAARLLIMATGEHKRRAVRALIEGPRDPAWPCSLLRDHDDLILVVDRAASPAGESR